MLHTHPTYSIALSSTGRPIKAYSQGGALYWEGIGNYSDTINLIRTHAMGAGVAKALGPHRAVLLKNHGIAVATASIAETVVTSIMLENAAQIQLAAEAAGDTAPEFPREDIEKLKYDIRAAGAVQGEFRLFGQAGEGGGNCRADERRSRATYRLRLLRIPMVGYGASRLTHPTRLGHGRSARLQ